MRGLKYINIKLFQVFVLFYICFSLATIAHALPSYWTDPSKGNCVSCHTAAIAPISCEGCHAHGTKSSVTNSSGTNLTAVTDHTSYAPGAQVCVTLDGGSSESQGQSANWIRAYLYTTPDATGNYAAVSWGPAHMGGGPGMPLQLCAPAPTTPGNYNWAMSWYGNKYDKSGYVYNANWRLSGNPNHGEQWVMTNLFSVQQPTAPNISLSTNLVAFGAVQVNNSSVLPVTVTNTGNANLVLGTIAQANPLAAPFSKTGDNCSGHTLTPNANCIFSVQFSPTAAASYSDSFDVPSNDPDSPSLLVNVTGTGTSAPTPLITVTDSVSPTTDHQIPFGSVTVGTTSDQTITVKNDGNANLILGTLSGITAPFSLLNDTCSGHTLAPTAICTATARFSPTNTVLSNGNVNIPSNDPTTPTVNVSMTGTGVPVAQPNIAVTDSSGSTTDHTISFGSIAVGLSSSYSITVTNSGSASLSVGSIASPNAPFSTQNDMCSNQSVAPSAQCTVQVNFTPTVEGPASDQVTIPSNDPDSPSVIVTLNGTGAPAGGGGGGTGNNPPVAGNLVYPANQQAGVSRNLTLSWLKGTDADGNSLTYDFYMSTDPSFPEGPMVTYLAYLQQQIFRASMEPFIALFTLTILLGSFKGRRRILAWLIMLTAVIGFTVACGSYGTSSLTDSGSNGSSTQSGSGPILGSNAMSYTVSNLQPNTLYYWKVKINDGHGGIAETQTWSFTTGQ